jgi:hypothetical protein
LHHGQKLATIWHRCDLPKTGTQSETLLRICIKAERERIVRVGRQVGITLE